MPYTWVGGAGVRRDELTGLFYMRQRWYDRGLKMFLSRDPIGLMGSTNTYAYCNANPLIRIDPMGLYGMSDAAIDSGALLSVLKPANYWPTQTDWEVGVRTGGALLNPAWWWKNGLVPGPGGDPTNRWPSLSDSLDPSTYPSLFAEVQSYDCPLATTFFEGMLLVSSLSISAAVATSSLAVSTYAVRDLAMRNGVSLNFSLRLGRLGVPSTRAYIIPGEVAVAQAAGDSIPIYMTPFGALLGRFSGRRAGQFLMHELEHCRQVAIGMDTKTQLAESLAVAAEAVVNSWKGLWGW